MKGYKILNLKKLKHYGLTFNPKMTNHVLDGLDYIDDPNEALDKLYSVIDIAVEKLAPLKLKQGIHTET